MTTLSLDFNRTDPTHLSEHFQQCVTARGRLHRLRCVAESLDAFLAPRFVTTLALLTLLMIAGVTLPG